MNPTFTPLGSDLPKQVIDLLLNAVEEGSKQASRMMWGILQGYLKEHWLLFIGILFVCFVAVTLKAMMGRWGSLGSLLYSFFYFGTLYIAGLIWGPEIFVDDFFNAACAVILYPLCYLLVGYILDKIGLKRGYF